MSASVTLRLSDERNWSSAPFVAACAADLRDGALEAFVALRTEWPALCKAPPHQKRKHTQHALCRPRTLFVHVQVRGHWCVVPGISQVLREPGSVPNARQAWCDEDWGRAYRRCLRIVSHVEQLEALAGWAASE